MKMGVHGSPRGETCIGPNFMSIFFFVYEDIPYGVATISRLLKIIGLFAEYSLFYRALLQERPMILRSLLIEATPYSLKSVCLSICIWI